MPRSTSETALIRLLRLAYSGELAAARAYEGHAASVRDEIERAEIEAIGQEQVDHRAAVGEMLAELGAEPSAARERISERSGATLSALCHLTGRLLPNYGAALLETKNVKEYDDAAALAEACDRPGFVAPLQEMAEVELAHERYFKAKVRAHRFGALLPLPPCTRDEPGGEQREELAQRRRGLLAALAATLLAALLIRSPLLGVPGHESGLVTALAAALAGCFLAFERARARPVSVTVRWGVLRKTPGEAVYEETRAALIAVAPLVLLPLFLLVTQAARTGCRWAPGVAPFLFVAVPAAFGGVALGIAFGSLTRKRRVACGLLAAFTIAGILTTLAEGLAGPRHVVHDLLLGPISVGAYMGYDRGLSFPPSVYLHRSFSLLAFAAVLAGAAWWRCRTDAPPVDENAPEPAEDGGWSASRADDATRSRFLLRHHRKGPRRLLALLAVLALPFLLNRTRPGSSPAAPSSNGRCPRFTRPPTSACTTHPGLRSKPISSVSRSSTNTPGARSPTGWRSNRSGKWRPGSIPTRPPCTARRALGVTSSPHRGTTSTTRSCGAVKCDSYATSWSTCSPPTSGAWPFRASWSTGLIEGLATALDEGYARVPEAHESIAAAHAAGHVPPAERLTSLTGFAGNDMDLSYRAAASFVGYLLQEEGPGPLKAAYAHGRFEGAYGASVDELGADWRRYLESEVDPTAVQAARARRRFDPGLHPAFYRRACPRLGQDRAFTSPVTRARLLALADRPAEAADAWCEAYRATADPRHLDAASRARVQAGELEVALTLVDRALASSGLDADQEVWLLRRRALLLATLARNDETSLALQEAAGSLQTEFGPGEFLAPRDAVLEQLSLDRQALSGPFAADYARAALQARDTGAEGPIADLLAEWPESAALLRLSLLASKPAGGEAGRRRDQLALRFARLSPTTPRLAAAHLAEQAAAAERETAWERAAALQEVLLALPELQALQRLNAEDGLERARSAPKSARAAASAQPGG